MAPRGATPQLKRSTRSGSREVSASPAATRSRRARSSEGDLGVEGGPGTTQRTQRGKKKNATSKLPVLDENPASLEDVEGHPHSLQQSPGAVSIASGATAVTQTTGVGGTDLDLQSVVYILPYLYNTAEDFLSVLAPVNATADHLASIIADLEDAGSAVSAQLKLRERAFTFYSHDLSESRYVDPPVFLRSCMRRQNIPRNDDSPWRPDDILLKANATNLARKTLNLERQAAEMPGIILELDNVFPALFITAFGAYASGASPIGSSSLLRQTMDLGIEIRTQALIATLMNLESDNILDPDVVLSQIFFAGAGPSQNDAQLRGWNTAQGPAIIPMREDFERQILERVERIRTHFSPGSDSVNWDDLAADFPWENFKVLLLDWCRMRNREINDMLSARGGAGEVVEMFEAEHQGIPRQPTLNPSSPSLSTQSNPMSQHFQPPMTARTQPTPAAHRRPAAMGKHQNAGNPIDPRDPADTALLKLLAKRVPGSILTDGGFTPPVQHSTAPPVLPVQHGDNTSLAEQQLHQENPWQQPPEVYDDVMPVPDVSAGNTGNLPELPEWQRTTLAAAGAEDGLRRSQTRRRRFIDPQPNAQRVEYGDDYSQTTAPLPRRSRNGNGKRPATDEDNDRLDPSQDVGFQTDDRNIDPAVRRAAAPVPQGRTMGARATQGPQKRARFSIQVEEVGGVDNLDHDAEAEDDDENRNTAASQYPQVKQLAREKVRAASAEGVRLAGTQDARGFGGTVGNPGKRRWAEDQEGRLIEYIGQFGCKWAEISKHDAARDGLLGQWSQVDLKDKASNMRVDHHKAGVPLPANFEYITLRRRDREKLEAMGIPY